MPDRASSPADRLDLFPISTQIIDLGSRSELFIADQALQDLASQYGTPLYIYDQATLDQNLTAYQESLANHYIGQYGITYAGKAFLCLALAQWVCRQGIALDCSSAGELHIAALSGIQKEQLVVHGVNKSTIDLWAAIQKAGTLVIDNLSELDRYLAITNEIFSHDQPNIPKIWLRLRPGVAVDTHTHIQTGQPDSKFGLDPGEFIQAVHTCLKHKLPLNGLHFHLGSHMHTTTALITAIETALDLIQVCRQQTGWLPELICPGGGWGVPYHEADLPHPTIETYVEAITQTVGSGCRKRHLPFLHIQLEPGRSLIAQAGVAVYRIGAVKKTPTRRYLLLDGGIADNPRPALYQASYTALPVINPLSPYEDSVWLAGPYCESGDILIKDIPMPKLQPDNLLAIPVSGAYQLSMSSNYNGACRPAVVWLNHGRAHLIQTRETVDDLSHRDLPLPE